MTVEIYKPIHRPSKSLQPSLRIAPVWTQPHRSMEVQLPPVRAVRESYRPLAPRLDLILAVEALTHPESPSFADLEWLAMHDGLST